MAALAIIAAGSANATTGNIEFGATIGGTCVVSIAGSGTLAIDSTLQNLNSLASPATGTIYTTGTGFTVDLDTPVLTRPVTDTTPVSSLGGAVHVFPSGGGTIAAFDTDPPAALPRDSFTMNIYLFASKSGQNIFTAGNYTGNMTVRCE